MSTIIYFSGTGNSYSVAKRIAQFDGAKLISIISFNGDAITDDCIGIVTPVYCGELPPIVKSFLQKVNLESSYIWAIAASGGTVGTTLLTIDKILNKIGRKLNFGAQITMPDNSIVTRPQKDESLYYLMIEKENVDKLYEKIKNRENGDYPVEQMLGRTSSIQWASLKYLLRCRYKKVNKKKCTFCGICIEVCPKGNISKHNGKIKIGKNCTDCFACLHWCPQTCISAGFIKLKPSEQYIHPDIFISDLKIKN